MPPRQEFGERISHLHDLAARIKANFYWSFHHSQRRSEMQKLLLHYCASKYQLPSISEERSHLLNILQPHIEKLQLPRQHLVIESIDPDFDKERFIKGEFQDPWNKHRVELLSGISQSLDQDSVRERKGLIGKITNLIINEDYGYQTKVRPQREEDDDKHESFLRSYAFEGKPVPPVVFPEFTVLYQEVQGCINELGIFDQDPSKEMLKQRSLWGFANDSFLPPWDHGFANDSPPWESASMLVALWERKHPGKRFIPHQ